MAQSAPGQPIFAIAAIPLLMVPVGGLSNIRLAIPNYAVCGSDVALNCSFNLQHEELYSVRWYRGTHEIFRFVPSQTPPTKGASRYDVCKVFRYFDPLPPLSAFEKLGLIYTTKFMQPPLAHQLLNDSPSPSDVDIISGSSLRRSCQNGSTSHRRRRRTACA